MTQNRKKYLNCKHDTNRGDIFCEDTSSKDYRVTKLKIPEYDPPYERETSRDRYNRCMHGMKSLYTIQNLAKKANTVAPSPKNYAAQNNNFQAKNERSLYQSKSHSEFYDTKLREEYSRNN